VDSSGKLRFSVVEKRCSSCAVSSQLRAYNGIPMLFLLQWSTAFKEAAACVRSEDCRMVFLPRTCLFGEWFNADFIDRRLSVFRESDWDSWCSGACGGACVGQIGYESAIVLRDFSAQLTFMRSVLACLTACFSGACGSRMKKCLRALSVLTHDDVFECHDSSAFLVSSECDETTVGLKTATCVLTELLAVWFGI